jgi:hypothetical protein
VQCGYRCGFLVCGVVCISFTYLNVCALKSCILPTTVSLSLGSQFNFAFHDITSSVTPWVTRYIRTSFPTTNLVHVSLAHNSHSVSRDCYIRPCTSCATRRFRYRYNYAFCFSCCYITLVLRSSSIALTLQNTLIALYHRFSASTECLRRPRGHHSHYRYRHRMLDTAQVPPRLPPPPATSPPPRASPRPHQITTRPRLHRRHDGTRPSILEALQRSRTPRRHGEARDGERRPQAFVRQLHF